MNYCKSIAYRHKKISELTLKNIVLVVLGIYLYLEIVAPHTNYSQMLMVLTALFCLCGLIYNKSFNYIKITFAINPLIISYSLYIIYQLFLCLCGFAYSNSTTLDEVTTMLISLVVVVIVFNYLYQKVSMDEFKTMFVWVGFFSLITVLFLCRDSIGTGRLAHVYREGTSYYFLGKAISVTSNGFAVAWSVSLYFLLDKFHKKASKLKMVLYLIMGILFILGVFLTGSRRGFMILALCCCGWLFINGKGNILIKIFAVILVAFLLYYLVLKIPVLYTTIGARLETLVNNILGLSEEAEGSMSARSQYGEYALKMFSKNKFFGYGSGYFNKVYGNVTENDYYDKLVSGGIAGFIIYYSFVVCAVVSFFRYRKKAKTKTFYSLAFLFAIILVSMWGSVTVLSRIYLIYLSLYFVYIKKLKKGIA